MAKQEHDMQIKILTIGDSSVGKTALLNQFANKQFSNAAIPTIGIGACRLPVAAAVAQPH
jgi:GTPase SAR1 family protein